MPSDLEYFRQRAAAERALAEVAPNAKVAAIHEELARGYEAIVRRDKMRVVVEPVVKLDEDQNQRAASA